MEVTKDKQARIFECYQNKMTISETVQKVGNVSYEYVVKKYEYFFNNTDGKSYYREPATKLISREQPDFVLITENYLVLNAYNKLINPWNS